MSLTPALWDGNVKMTQRERAGETGERQKETRDRKQHQPNVPVVVQEKPSQDVHSQNLPHKRGDDLLSKHNVHYIFMLLNRAKGVNDLSP